MTAAVSQDRTDTPRTGTSQRRSTRPARSASSGRPAPRGQDAPPRESAAPQETAPQETAPQETAAQQASPGQRLAKVASDLLVAAVDRLAGAAADKVDDVVAKFDEIKASGGVGLNAMISAGLAKLQGQNPVWAAIKGAVGAMSTSTKVWVGLLLILTAVLAPVVLLVLAVLLLVLAIAGAVSGGS